MRVVSFVCVCYYVSGVFRSVYAVCVLNVSDVFCMCFGTCVCCMFEAP